MTSIAETPLNRLETEKRLINVNLKEAGSAAGSFLYRGELAIKLNKVTKLQALPPELKADQVMISALAGQTELPFYTCHLSSFELLKPMTELLGDMLGAAGKYFVFCANLNANAKYRVKMGEATFNVLPLKDGSAYNELVDLFEVDRDLIKKRSLGGKVEAVVQAASQFNSDYEQITYERGLEVMKPVPVSVTPAT